MENPGKSVGKSCENCEKTYEKAVQRLPKTARDRRRAGNKRLWKTTHSSQRLAMSGQQCSADQRSAMIPCLPRPVARSGTQRALSCPPRWGCEADTASWGGWHAPTRFAVRRQHPMRVTGEVGTCGLMIGDGWMRITLCFSASFPCAAVWFPGNRRFSRHTRMKTRKSIIRKNEENRGNRRKSKQSICILKKFQKWVDIRFAL